MYTVLPETHTHTLFPVDLLSQSNYSRLLPPPEGSDVNFKVQSSTPCKTGASVHDCAAGGAGG